MENVAEDWDELLETNLHVGTAHVLCTMVKKTWRTKKMTTLLLRRFVYLTIVKILAQFKETILFIKHISCSLTQVDVYLAQALANNLYLFQVRTAEFFPTLTTCGN